MEISRANQRHKRRLKICAIFNSFAKIRFRSFFPTSGLCLLCVSGMHIVWAVFQVLYFETSSLYKKAYGNDNKTSDWSTLVNHISFPDWSGLYFVVIIWYIGGIIGNLLAGRYLLPSVQKKNIYVSFPVKVYD